MQQNRREFIVGTALAGAGLTTSMSSLAAEVPTSWQASGSSFPEIICSRSATPPVRYAAEQLDSYLRQILGNDAPTLPGRGPRILLEEVDRDDLGSEGFELLSQGRDLFIRGTPSGIVYGAFEFLRQHAGCQFTGYAPDAEEIPKRETLALPAFHSVHKPTLWYRGLQFPWREPLELVVKRLDWMAKNGMNYILYMPLRDDVTDPIGGLIDPRVGDAAERTRLRYTEAWFREYVQPEVLRRGLKLDFDLHNLGYWLPSEKYYDEHPEWYAMFNGQRTRIMDHKQLCICTSHKGGVDTLVQNVLAFLRANPAVHIVGIVQEDGYGMCQCDLCVRGDLDPKDAFRPYAGNSTPAGENASKTLRYARLVNNVAKAVAKEFPGRSVMYVSYNDLRWPPRGVTLEPNVVVEFALGGRDVAHPISGDSPSPVNRFAFDVLRQWKQAHSGKIIVDDLYMGMHLMKSFPLPMAEAVCQEWPHLKRLGIDGATIQCWSTNHETYCMQTLAFARNGWQEEVEFDRVFEDYLSGAFGSASAQVRPVFAGLQEAVRNAARDKFQPSFFLSRSAPGSLIPADVTVGYFLEQIEQIPEEVLRKAVIPVNGGREEAQVRTLATMLEYWRRGAEVMRLELLAERAAREGHHDEAAALYERAIGASEAIILYINAQPPRGWISASTPAAWRESAMKWRAAIAQHQFTSFD